MRKLLLSVIRSIIKLRLVEIRTANKSDEILGHWNEGQKFSVDGGILGMHYRLRSEG